MSKDIASDNVSSSSSIPPDGVLPFFLPDAAATKYEMKTGTGITDLIHRKTFNTSQVIQEIKTYGFMCPFEPYYNPYLKDCNLDEFVVVCDTDMEYGEMFLLLYKESSIATFRSVAEKEEEKSLAKQKEIQMQKLEEEEIVMTRQNNVYMENSVLPKSYVSSTSDETEKEVGFLTGNNTKNAVYPLARIFISRPRNTKSSCISDVSLFSSISSKSNENELERITCLCKDAWTQIPLPQMDSSMQTNWNRKVNKIIQYEPLSLSDYGLNYETILGDVCLFLRSTIPRIERALQENETVDIYSNIFIAKEQDLSAADLMTREVEPMKEIRSFTDLEYTKEKLICSIDIHPMKDIIAVSACETENIEDKIYNSGLVKSSYIILWKFSEQIHPYRILVAPTDCPVCKFNPTTPHIVVAGCDGGQVIIWNTMDRDEIVSSSSHPTDGRKVLVPFAISSPDQSHKQGVADISWLPPHIQINARGHLLPKEYLTDVTHQFYTVSGDGQILFWDIRFEAIILGKLPHIMKVKNSKQTQHSETDWKPLFKIKPKRLSGTGELSLCKTMIPTAQDGSTSVILCSSEEGEVLQVDWSPKLADGNNQEADFASPEYVQWMKRDHHRPCVALSQHHALPSFFLSVSDWNFHIWKDDSESMNPVFTSPHSSCHITGGEWSPSRPSLVFISKSNGSIDVWDFTESFYEPTETFSLIPNKILSMKFLESTSGKSGQFIAIGDNHGSLHIFGIPGNLVDPYPHEQKSMLKILNRSHKWKPMTIPTCNEAETHDKKIEVEHAKNRDVVEPSNDNPTLAYDRDSGLTSAEEALYLELESRFLN